MFNTKSTIKYYKLDKRMRKKNFKQKLPSSFQTASVMLIGFDLRNSIYNT